MRDELIEAMARAAFERRHKGAKNCYAWDDFWEENEYQRVHYMNEAEAALAAIEARGMLSQGWQPIESAPRDRTHVLVKVREDAFAGSYSGRCFVAFHEGATSSGGYDLGWALFPGFGGVGDADLEGWHPLPAPPVAAAEGVE